MARRLDARLQHVGPGRANVVATLRGRRAGPTLLLAGHLDTSYAGTAEIDYPGLGPSGPNVRPRAYLVEDGVYGLGAFNMKGGLAAAAHALVELSRGPRLAGDVVFAGVCGETEKAPVPGPARAYLGPAFRGRGIGARRFLRRHGRIDFAVVAGPSALRVVNAQAGSLFIHVMACGSAAYLGHRTPGSEAAIEVVAALVGELSVWGSGYRARHAMSTGLGSLEPGLTVGAIESGWPFAPSTSPAVCNLYLDLRVAPGQSAVRALGELRACLDGFTDRHRGIRLRAGVFARGVGTMTPVDDPLVRAAVDVLERDLGLEAAPFPAGSADTSNDSNAFRRRGIPSIKMGPSDRLDANAGATARHGPHVSTGDLVAAARFYVRLAHRLVGTGSMMPARPRSAGRPAAPARGARG